ncbi:MAG: DUF4347 domain-containing protein [Gammaproteobacteria bacterium]|nr:DUF4347 domain-containing protein [Gammaproteobacteria bacterium]
MSTSNKTIKSIFGALVLTSALFGGAALALVNTNIAHHLGIAQAQKKLADTNQIHVKQILFIDSAVAERKTLLDGIDPNIEVVLVNKKSDGLKQVAEALRSRSGIEALHIISHGQSGSLQLGSSRIDHSKLETYVSELSTIGKALTVDGDILFYGCNVANGIEGMTFVKALSEITGADIAASTGLTGSRELEGDWKLEVATGVIESKLALNQIAMDVYADILVDVVIGTAGQPALTESFAGFDIGQSFIATKTGVIKDIQVATGIGPTGGGSITLDIYSGTTITAPNKIHTQFFASPLAVTATTYSSYTYNVLTLDANVNINNGVTYTFVLSPGPLLSLLYAVDVYPSGDLYSFDLLGGFSGGAFDMIFQVTQGDLLASVPDAPTIGIATAGDAQASVAFTPPATDGGSAILSYTATSSPGNLTSSGCAVSPCTVTGLSNGTAYTFTVTATNTIGTSSASAASNSVTPKASQTVSFTSTAPAATVGGATYTPTATATSGLTVALTVDAASSAICTINTGIVSFNAAGSCVLNANQAGDTNYNAAVQVQQSVTVGKASQTVSFTSTAPAATVGGATYTPTATATSGLTVALTVDAASSAICTINTGIVSFNAAGSCVLNANQAGDTNYNAAVQVSQTVASSAVAPDAPSIGTAIGGNAQAGVSFTAPSSDGGSTITGYTVTSSPAGGTDSNAGTTGLNHTIIGLNNGTAYTFTVTATNAYGTSPASTASNSVTPATIPDAPSGVTATGGFAQATVSFIAPADNGGDAIIGYTVTSSPAGGIDVDADTPNLTHTITGLTDGVAYTFTVTATNGVGTGVASVASNSISPDSPPVITLPADITINAVGLLSPVSTGLATASDSTDGSLTPTSNATSHYSPGAHTVVWSATDTGGNTATANQTINVTPLVGFSGDQAGREGDTVTFKVILNGEAATYPVTLPYTISGTATSITDHDLIDGSVDILAANVEAVITVNLVNDGVGEGDETLIVTLGTPVNAVKGTADVHTLVITENNLAPQVTLSADQGSGNTHLIAQANGSVIVTAAVSDSVGDVHSFDWTATDNALVDTDVIEGTFSFDPTGLTPGQYTLRVAVDDGTNTSNTDILLDVVATAPVLSAIDTDGDGVDDDIEGFADSDDDGIADYLDNSGLASNVALEQTGITDRFLMETEPGLTASLGSVAFRAGVNATGVTMSDIEIHANDGAGVTADAGVTYSAGLFDFNVSNLATAGQSVRVVLAQFTAIPVNAVYRKLIAGNWQDFVEDTNNSLASAPGEAGICPPPGDVAYVSGLNEGDWCVQLTIEDGGLNDADGVVNQSISDPGGVVNQPIVDPVVVTATDHTEPYVILAFFVGSTNPVWLLLILGLLPLRRKLLVANTKKH